MSDVPMVHMLDGKPIPMYRCHKEVGALKIRAVVPAGIICADVGATVAFEDDTFPPLWCGPELFVRFTPVPGDYLVVYADGYQSWSPSKAFEDGYTRIEG